MHAPQLIKAESLSKRFALRGRGRFTSGVDALADVSFTVGPGITAVVGPNGAGKSTLFALLLGFLKPTSGEVSIAGLAPRDYLNSTGAGYLPERFSLPSGWRVRDALRALARADGIEDVERRAHECIERFELGSHADKSVDALSRGLLQRVGLAQAFAGEHELMVLDEPTEGLDPLWRIRLRELLRDAADAGRTVLLASHDLAEVERLADCVIVLDGGRLQEIMTVQPATSVLVRRITVASGAEHVAVAFPDAERESDDAPTFIVAAADPGELSARLAALLDAGARVSAVEPAAPGLEERVRARLAGGRR